MEGIGNIDDFIIVNELTLYKKPYQNYNYPKLIKLPEGHDFEKMGELSVVYVDKSELSYHNMETIIDEERNFSINFGSIKLVGDSIFGLTSDCYYQESGFFVNKEENYRGGNKYIIRSNKIASELTRKLKKILPAELLEDFLHVNNVFRINQFEPEDNEFKPHYDTPFISKNKISKYTIILYCSNCINSGILSFDDLQIDNITHGDTYIFDQRLIHSGKPPLYGHKKFMRSELLYVNRNENFDPECAKLFNISCYFSKKVNFSNYSSDLFNKTMQKRINPELKFDVKYLLKNCRGINFITNGNDYYFLKEINLKDIAIVIIVDYFNARKRLEQIKCVEIPGLNLEFLQLDDYDLDIYKELNMIKYEDAEFDYDVSGCPFDTHDSLISDHSADYMPALHYCKSKLKSLISDRNVCLFGKEIYVNEKMIVITKDYIAFEGIYLDPLNYASCQCDLDIPVYHKYNCLDSYHVPPIKYELVGNYLKLSIDLFNNGFTYGFTYDKKVYFEQPYTQEKNPYHYNSDPIDPRILVPITKIKSEISNFIQSDIAGLISEYASEYKPCYKKDQIKSVSTYTYNECNGEIILYMKSYIDFNLSYCPVFETFIDRNGVHFSIGSS